MVVAVIQTQTGANSGGASTGISASLTATGANSLLVLVYGTNSNNALTGVTDNKSNTWVKVDAVASITNTLEVWYCQSPASAVTLVSVSYASNATPCGIAVREYSGLTNRAVDVHQINSAQTGTNPSSPTTGVSTQENELIFGYLIISAVSPVSVGSGFSNFFDFAPQTGTHISIEDKTVSSTGTQQAVFTDGSSVTYSCGVASFIIGGSTTGLYLPLLKNG